MDVSAIVLLLAAGLAAGAVNALAGGGSLITFPALLAIGLPPIPANVTNSVSVCPGYLSSVAGSRRELSGQRRRALHLLPTTAVGTAVGCLLLLNTPAAAFTKVVPFLVIGAALMLAFQGRLRSLVGHPDRMSPVRRQLTLHGSVAVGAVYGGYFGAALGVMLVAVLSLVVQDVMHRVGALKNVLSAVVGLVTVTVFGLFGPVDWVAVLILAPATITGGYLGVLLARRLPASVLRWAIVVFGLAIGGYLLLQAF